MFTVTRAIEETLFQHFIHQKLEIAYAIYKPFPFFETLRDNSLITERMYRVGRVSCFPTAATHPKGQSLRSHPALGVLEFGRPSPKCRYQGKRRCCNKWPQPRWLKTLEMYSLTVLEGRSSESRFWQGWLPPEALREICSPALLPAGGAGSPRYLLGL